ncbi:hypothetical protein CEXT_662241 [Caerostris extrusa]|uniref:Uncharacterized protein n=1 Tax=Caerostris extrusa TaxID=172846 RepID=A0AAV4XX73_CAEEX|nr:hypothetical protein CEXT_662241 [Caerostris extrusa]
MTKQIVYSPEKGILISSSELNIIVRTIVSTIPSNGTSKTIIRFPKEKGQQLPKLLISKELNFQQKTLDEFPLLMRLLVRNLTPSRSMIKFQPFFLQNLHGRFEISFVLNKDFLGETCEIFSNAFHLL